MCICRRPRHAETHHRGVVVRLLGVEPLLVAEPFDVSGPCVIRREREAMQKQDIAPAYRRLALKCSGFVFSSTYMSMGRKSSALAGCESPLCSNLAVDKVAFGAWRLVLKWVPWVRIDCIQDEHILNIILQQLTRHTSFALGARYLFIACSSFPAISSERWMLPPVCMSRCAGVTNESA